ncbi:MAG: hypothetical protein U0822_14170 [Anaerolineae bacterium]
MSDQVKADQQAKQGLSTADIAAGSRPGQAQDAKQTAQAAARPDEARQHEAPLLPGNMTEDFRTRWKMIQTTFVDEPRQAVEQADALVAEVMQKLASTFASERDKLENQWSKGDNVSTEDLRVALQRYRTFFDRLLSI